MRESDIRSVPFARRLSLPAERPRLTVRRQGKGGPKRGWLGGLTGAALLASSVATAAPAAASEEVRFNRDIRPLLSNTCFQCHGPDEKKREGGLRLDTFEGATAELASGARAIVPGHPEQSEMLKRMTSHDPDEVMPPPSAKKPPVTEAELETLRRWIAQGAPYEGHWAFLPLSSSEPPAVQHEAWVKTPLDRFILARLEAEGIAPSPEAPPAILLRRLHLDLTGLPPTPEEIAAFEDAYTADPDAAVRAKVDELLASPHYGERWGRHWLDQARYADSNGYSIDGDRAMWPYRDWVINALNRDLPFDQFTIEQLAGDLLPQASKEQRAATAFHRNTLINEEGGTDPEQFRVESVIDRVNTTGAVWLGLTLSCAQCHSHKYDPISQREYYQLYAFFNNTTDKNNAGATIPVQPGEFLKDPYAESTLREVRGTQPVVAKTPRPARPAAPKKKNAEIPPLPEFHWRPVTWTSYATESNAGFERLPDNSLLSDGRGSFNDTYRLAFQTATTAPVTALRLRVLPHESLPNGGPGLARNGNFVLTHVEVTYRGQPVKIAAAFADHEQDNYPARATIDDDPRSGWAINVRPNSGQKIQTPRALTWLLAQPLEITDDGTPLEVRLYHGLNENYLIGRFVLETASEAVASERLAALAKADAPSSPKPAALMVMEEASQPRETFIFQRGDFTRPDREAGPVKPGVLAAVDAGFPRREPREYRNRLDLAKWLVDPGNPLTPRVTVNRVWMRYFGRGLVETEEDFGTQGTPPTHPELLDWLASEFIRGGWSMKHLHRLITTSATYRQSSKARPDLEEKDPRNLLLARQSRLRLDAEIVRDAALAASGLLTPNLGGPSVRPPQPPAVYAFTQVQKRWEADTGPNRYRRTLYTFFYRSAPHPLFGTFDAPDFQVTCTRRAKSNTPLQSLLLANDPMFLEFAQGLAARVVEEVPGEFEAVLWPRLRRAFAYALGRQPQAEEVVILAQQTRQFREDFAASPAEGEALAFKNRPAHITVAEAAALTNAARILFNLDEFITRE